MSTEISKQNQLPTIAELTMDFDSEIWKDVPSYHGLYKVSNLGRVKRLKKVVKCKNGMLKSFDEKLLTGCYDKDKYIRYSLTKDGYCKSIKGHVLVCSAFMNYSNRHLYCIDHKNNIKQDNRLENLQIITIRENCNKDRHGESSKYHGVSKKGDKWIARININNKRLWLGTFNSEIEAHSAYQTKLKLTK